MKITPANVFAVFVLIICSIPARFALAEQVDVELVLAVDVSGSMSSTELRLQRRGYAEALSSKQVHDAIAKGLIGTIAVTYVEWARSDLKKVIVPWTRISTPEDAMAFAERLMAAEYANMRNTSITGAINYGVNAIASNDFVGLRRVIDISGDGPNNEGGQVTLARDEAVASGHIINGLPLMIEPWRSGLAFNIPNLDAYYRTCVIGGPGAFVIAVESWEGFPEAVRRKIVLELAGDTPPKVWQADFHEVEQVDCMIGERLRRMWQDPCFNGALTNVLS